MQVCEERKDVKSAVVCAVRTTFREVMQEGSAHADSVNRVLQCICIMCKISTSLCGEKPASYSHGATLLTIVNKSNSIYTSYSVYKLSA